MYRFDLESCVEILKQWPKSDGGYINRRGEARKYLQTLRPDLDDSASKESVLRQEDRYHVRGLETDKFLGFKKGTEPLQKLARKQQSCPKVRNKLLHSPTRQLSRRCQQNLCNLPALPIQ